MTGPLLILTEPGDEHAYAVAEAFARRGDPAVVWHTPDYPSRTAESVHFSERSKETSIGGLDLSGPPFATVWHRRTSHALDPRVLHPADCKFADAECRQFRQGLFDLLAPDAFWVNPPAAVERANLKLRQHRLAVEVGLAMPETLYTNDPEQIRGFLRGHGGRIIYKPFRALGWQDVDAYWAPYTSVIAEEQLVADELLRATPGIYQPVVPKDHELRITVMGHTFFAVKIRSQETTEGRLDWRRAYHELKMEPCAVPAELAKRCLALLARLGLVFGCFDFIVTPDGETLFLEVNEAGQFLFIEDYTDLSLLAPMCDFLRQGRPGFTWARPEFPPLRYADVATVVQERVRQACEEHVLAPERAEWEGAAAHR